MRRIFLSLITIAAVSLVGFGATRAFFTDTETKTGNTFSSGTIDIAVNNQNPWEQTSAYELKDMKPSQTEYINFTINNVGTNPVNVWKKITLGEEKSGTVTEPECVDQEGNWNGQTCVFSSNGDNNHISSVINYDLSVKVYRAGDTQPYWFQTIYTDSDNKTLDKLDQERGEFLGMIPAGGKMEVSQSYHMQSDTPNWAQGDILTFDITLFAEQLTNTVKMVSKSGPDWADIDQEELPGKYAELVYKVKDDDFKYDLSVKGLTPNTNYVLVSGTNPWNGSDTVEIKAFTTNSSGDYSINNQTVELNQNLTNAKVWVILASDWNSVTKTMINWHGDSYLFETGLIDYYDADL